MRTALALFIDNVIFRLPLVRHSASTVIANLDLPKQDIAGNTQRLHELNFMITRSLNITKITRFFFFFFFFGGGGGGLSEWAINFLTGVGTNLYDSTDDSKKIEI